MILGIDLGTTNSLAAVWRDGRPEPIPNALGELLTPSCVSLDEDDSILVGRAARERLQTHPDRTAAVFKRYMGNDKRLGLGNREFRPEELSALVLRSLKADAEAYLGEPVTEAIVSVPAYFSDAQRKATRAAGQLAGLQVDRLLNEPTAAALAYGMHQRGSETRFLVFDLGGGTFDVSILEMFEGVMEVRATAGDNMLGGEDWTSVLRELFFRRTDLPAERRLDGTIWHRLSAQAEAAKCALSTTREATMQVHDGEALFTLQLDQATFEQESANLLHRLRAPVERALRDANLRAGQLDAVVLAGGATRMPMVRRLVTSLFGRFPLVELDPDQVVALGASVQAGLKARDAALQEVVMTDVAPYSMGLAVTRELPDGALSPGHFDPVIERNSPVPISRVNSYWPLREGQRELDLLVFQGEARMVADDIPLGHLKVPLPPLPMQESEVRVRFTYDVNGLLEIEATVAKTGRTSTVVIEGNPGLLTPEEIAERLRRLSALKIHPRDQLENRTALARAERLYQLLRGGKRTWLADRIVEFEQALGTQDPTRAAAARKRLAEILDAIEREPLFDSDPS